MAPETNQAHQIHANLILDRMKHRFSSPEELLNEYELGKKPSYRKFRWRSILTRRSSSMSRGKLYLADENEIYSVLTNYPTVNYLNLEEYVYCGHQVPPDDSSRRYIRTNLNHNPLIEDQLLCHYFGDYRLTFLEEMAWLRDKFCSVMERESYVAASLPLLKGWDVDTYRDLLARCVDGPSRLRWDDRAFNVYNSNEIGRMLLEILFACCEDSSVVAEAILKISEHCGAVGLSLYARLVLVCHVQRANLDISIFDDKIYLLDVLSHALCAGNLEIMKLGLELELSSGYSINPVWIMFERIRCSTSRIGEWMEPKYWPRKKDGLHSESFYSVEFYSAFTHITCYAALQSILDLALYHGGCSLNIVGCFKLLWRAVPTPYLPIEDMRRGVDFRAIQRYHMYTYSENVLEHAFWSEAVAKLFEDDFPTEFRPRSLKHLSRYAVRRRFRSPQQISSLPLPASLKRYLMLET